MKKTRPKLQLPFFVCWICLVVTITSGAVLHNSSRYHHRWFKLDSLGEQNYKVNLKKGESILVEVPGQTIFKIHSSQPNPNLDIDRCFFNGNGAETVTVNVPLRTQCADDIEIPTDAGSGCTFQIKNQGLPTQLSLYYSAQISYGQPWLSMLNSVFENYIVNSADSGNEIEILDSDDALDVFVKNYVNRFVRSNMSSLPEIDRLKHVANLYHSISVARLMDREDSFIRYIDLGHKKTIVQGQDGLVMDGLSEINVNGPAILELTIRTVWPSELQSNSFDGPVKFRLNSQYLDETDVHWILDTTTADRKLINYPRSYFQFAGSKSDRKSTTIPLSFPIPFLVYLPESGPNTLHLECPFSSWISIKSVVPNTRWPDWKSNRVSGHPQEDYHLSDTIDPEIVFPLKYDFFNDLESTPAVLMSWLRIHPNDPLAEMKYQFVRNQAIWKQVDSVGNTESKLVDPISINTLRTDESITMDTPEKWYPVTNDTEYTIEFIPNEKKVHELHLWAEHNQPVDALVKIFIDQKEVNFPGVVDERSVSRLQSIYVLEGRHTVKIQSAFSQLWLDHPVDDTVGFPKKLKKFYQIDSGFMSPQVFRIDGGVRGNLYRYEGVFSAVNDPGKIFYQMDNDESEEIFVSSNHTGQVQFGYQDWIDPGLHELRIWCDPEYPFFISVSVLQSYPWETPDIHSYIADFNNLSPLFESSEANDDASEDLSVSVDLPEKELIEFYKSGEVKSLIQHYLQFRDKWTKTEDTILYSMILAKAGYFRHAVRLFEQISETEKNIPDWYRRMGLQAALEAGRIDVATDQVDALSKTNAQDVELEDAIRKLMSYHCSFAQHFDITKEWVALPAISSNRPRFGCVDPLENGEDIDVVQLTDEFFYDTEDESFNCSNMYYQMEPGDCYQGIVDRPGLLRIMIRPDLQHMLSAVDAHTPEIEIGISTNDSSSVIHWSDFEYDRPSLHFSTGSRLCIPAGRPEMIDLYFDRPDSHLTIEFKKGMGFLRVMKYMPSLGYSTQIFPDEYSAKQYDEIIQSMDDPISAMGQLLPFLQLFPESQILNNLEYQLNKKLTWTGLYPSNDTGKRLKFLTCQRDPAVFADDLQNENYNEIRSGEKISYFLGYGMYSSIKIQNLNHTDFPSESAVCVISLDGKVIGTMSRETADFNIEYLTDKNSQLTLEFQSGSYSEKFEFKIIGFAIGGKSYELKPQQLINLDLVTNHNTVQFRTVGPTILRCEFIDTNGLEKAASISPKICWKRTDRKTWQVADQAKSFPSRKYLETLDGEVLGQLQKVFVYLPDENLYDVIIKTELPRESFLVRLSGCSEKTIDKTMNQKALALPEERTEDNKKEATGGEDSTASVQRLIGDMEIPAIRDQSQGTWRLIADYRNREMHDDTAESLDIYDSDGVNLGLGYQQRFEGLGLYADTWISGGTSIDSPSRDTASLEQIWTLNTKYWDLRSYLDAGIHSQSSPDSEHSFYLDWGLRRTFKVDTGFAITPAVGVFYRDFSMSSSDAQMLSYSPPPKIYNTFDYRHDLGAILELNTKVRLTNSLIGYAEIRSITAGDGEPGFLGIFWTEAGIKKFFKGCVGSIVWVDRCSLKDSLEPDRTRIKAEMTVYFLHNENINASFSIMDQYTFQTDLNLVQAGLVFRFGKGRYFRDIDPYRMEFESNIEQFFANRDNTHEY